MGLRSSMQRSAALRAGQTALPGNPNPDRFKIVSLWPVGNYFVSTVHYPDCANYEGRKILVTRSDPSLVARLDPHFTAQHELNAGLIARFEPTTAGELLALKFAHWLSEGDA